MQMTYKVWILCLVFLVSSCGLLSVKDAEEKSDLYAAASLDAIHLVQQSAKRMYDADNLAVANYEVILVATLDLSNLISRIESGADALDYNGTGVACVDVLLDDAINKACTREDIAEILVKIRGMLDE
jgi:hypothetical protein